MGLTYFKRYRMEIDLRGRKWSGSRLPQDYRFEAWTPDSLEYHAEIKYQSFRSEVDANVFPCFNDRAGCLRLMDEISRKEGFLPAATWLMVYQEAGSKKAEYCGTVQGIHDTAGYGAIQNLGVTPLHRGRGLGWRLMHQALGGFQRFGLKRAYLEVTAQNEAAVQLYQRIGFRRVRTLYKAVEVAYA